MSAAEYLSVSEVAHLPRLTPLTVYRSIQRGDLPALRLSAHGTLRVPRSALELPASAPRGGGMEAA